MAVLLSSLAAAAQTASVAPSDELGSGALAGRVCEDQDGDGHCAPDEPGIPGARVLLSDGTFAVADADGRWHILGVLPRQAELVAASGEQPIGFREAYGRLLVKLDVGRLGRPAEVRPQASRVVEWGPAALHTVDFAVSWLATRKTSIEPAGPELPSRGLARGASLAYRLTGRAGPGHRVEVAGVPAREENGAFAAEVPVETGMNQIQVVDWAPGGALAFHLFPVAVVKRERGGVLFVPSPPREVATLAFPRADAAPVGPSLVSVSATPGTRVSIGGKPVDLDAVGAGRAVLELSRGRNAIVVTVKPSGGPELQTTVELAARPAPVAAGLLGVELSFDPGRSELSLAGRGTAALERTAAGFDLSLGADLDGGDVLTLTGSQGRGFDPWVLTRPRQPAAIERALDPELHPPATGDQGVTGSLNPARSRIWASASHPDHGSARLGVFHADLGGAQVGRYLRSLSGAAVDGRHVVGPATLRARLAGTPPADPAALEASVPAHDELAGTGGSLLYLRSGDLLPGSEKLRIELRDGLSSLPLEERALVRGVDYEIDYPSGRVLLAKPLQSISMGGPLLTTALQSHRPVLVADYERRLLGAAGSQVLGAQLGVEAAGASVSASAVRDDPGGQDAYALFGLSAKAKVGPVFLAAEAARSDGWLFSPASSGGFGLSDTGGLSWLTASRPADPGTANAVAARVAVSEERYGGQLWFSGREAGFNDSAWASASAARQLGGRARFSLGGFELGLTADDRSGADPRDPLGAGSFAGRDGAFSARTAIGKLSLAAESRIAWLEMAPDLGEEPLAGGRIGVGARADYALTRELSVGVSHHQRVHAFGQGPGALDDTFAALSASWKPKDELGFSARGGWGPALGTQVQVGAERAGADEVGYGSWTVDVDGPDAGRTAAVSGARRRVDELADVYAEDLFARDVDALRAGRAVGLDLAPTRSLRVNARYERGVRLPFTGGPGLSRDTGGARVSWLAAGLRLSLLAEIRRERGDAVAEADVDRWQTVAGLAAEARPWRFLTLAGRLNLSKTRNRGLDEAQLVEGTLGAGMRLDPWVVLASYSVINQFRIGFEDRAREYFHTVSLRPSAVLSERWRLGGGVHLGHYRGRAPATVVSASLRPSVRVVGGLETAVEVARRSAAPDGQSLDALRAELGYWLEPGAGLALGYNLYGFAGSGVGAPTERADRIYLRLELAR